MYVQDESALGFLSTFHQNQNDISIAILILALRKVDIEIYKELIDGVAELDEALGREIGMFLTIPAHMAVMTATRTGRFLHDASAKPVDKSGKLKLLREMAYFDFTQTPEYLALSRAAIVGKNIQIVSEFSSIFGIDPEKLPCVCILIKGVDGAVVIESGDRLSYIKLVQSAIDFKNRLVPIKLKLGELVDGVGAFNDALTSTDRTQKKLEKLAKQILDRVNTLQEKHGVTMRPQIVAALTSGQCSATFIDNLVRSIGGSSYEQITKDSRASAIKIMADEWAELHGRVRMTARSFDIAALTAKKVGYDSIVREIHDAADSAFSNSGISARQINVSYSEVFKYFSPIVGLIMKGISLLSKASA